MSYGAKVYWQRDLGGNGAEAVEVAETGHHPQGPLAWRGGGGREFECGISVASQTQRSLP